MTGPTAPSLKAGGPIEFDRLAALVAQRDPSHRTIVAIAGAPGSGKSTLAERLVARLNRDEAGCAAILPMDGFHYDDRVLIDRGLRARKGAPQTFDAAGLFHMLDRLRRDEEDQIAVPVFDRDLEISRAGARLIPRAVRLLIAEGNYLLVNEAPWSRLRPMFDVTVWVDAPDEVLRRRLIARWRRYGLTPDEIDAKVEGNDLPNARYAILKSGPADFVLRS